MRLTGGTPIIMRIIIALAVAPPLVRFGYAISRDSELEPYVGRELWNRVWITSAVLAATWLIYVFITPYVLDIDYASEMGLLASGISLVVMLAFGSIAAMAAFELELFGGMIIAGVYVAATLLLAILGAVQLVTV